MLPNHTENGAVGGYVVHAPTETHSQEIAAVKRCSCEVRKMELRGDYEQIYTKY